MLETTSVVGLFILAFAGLGLLWLWRSGNP